MSEQCTSGNSTENCAELGGENEGCSFEMNRDNDTNSPYLDWRTYMGCLMLLTVGYLCGMKVQIFTNATTFLSEGHSNHLANSCTEQRPLAAQHEPQKFAANNGHALCLAMPICINELIICLTLSPLNPLLFLKNTEK